jgi:hypothetical protein
MHVNPELWLVGGRRRGNFIAEDGETKSFAIMLLPQRSGHLLLPSIDIKTFVSGPPTAPVGGPGGVSTPTATTAAAANSVTVPTTGANPGGIPAGAATPLQQRRQIPNEVDYKNHGETLLVLPDLRKTTVSLESGNLGLIESEPRIKF